MQIIATIRGVSLRLVNQLSDAEDRAEEDAVLTHPVQVHVEGHRGAPERPEMVVSVDDGEPTVGFVVVSVPTNGIVLVAQGEPGQRPFSLQSG